LKKEGQAQMKAALAAETDSYLGNVE